MRAGRVSALGCLAAPMGIYCFAAALGIGSLAAAPRIDPVEAGSPGAPDSLEWTPRVEILIPADSLGGGATEAWWSPDGRRILVACRRGLVLVENTPGFPGSWILDRHPDEVVWSPAGNAIAYLQLDRSTRIGHSALRILDLETRAVRTLCETSGLHYAHLAWPDSLTLVYRDDREPEPVFLTPDGGSPRLPGNLFYAWIDPGLKANVWSAQSGARRLESLPGQWWGSRPLAVSQERRCFTATSDVDGEAARVYILDAEGSILRGLRSDFEESDWAGGGRWLLGTVSTDDGHRVLTEDLAVADPETGLVRVLAGTPDAIETAPRWSAANRRLVYVAGGSVVVARVAALED